MQKIFKKVVDRCITPVIHYSHTDEVHRFFGKRYKEMIRSRKVFRCIHADELREMCIRQNYFTCGDVDAYGRMLQWVTKCKDINSSDVMAIAEYIYTYSDVEDECKMYGCSPDDYFNNIYFNIGEIVHWFCE